MRCKVIQNLYEKKYNWKCQAYLNTLLFTLLVIVVLIWRLGLYPFGNHNFQYLDADQYYGYYGYWVNSFFSNDNLLYSWSMALGNQMWSTYAYYASSPFNFLLLFFKNNLLLGIQFVIFFKTIFTALSLCKFLNEFYDGFAIEKGIISTSYAFIGYVVFYAWNSSWMDGVAFLPLMALGLKRLLLDKKKVLYTMILALSIVSNFYIGYMLCMASGLFYLTYIVFYGQFSEWMLRIKNTMIRYVFCSGVAVGMSAVILLPTYLALPSSRPVGFKELVDSFVYNFDAVDLLSVFYTNSITLAESADNLPVIFIGIIQTVLVILYFINKEISLHQKAARAVPVIILAISFQWSILNIIWHGLSRNICFNYRYSFILSFLLLLISFESLVKLPKNKNTVCKALGIFLFITAFVFTKDRANFDAKTLSLDIIIAFLGIAALGICYYLRPKYRLIGKGMLVFLMLFNLTMNSIVVLADAATGTNSTLTDNYFERKEKIDVLKKYLQEDDKIIRSASLERIGRCDASMFGYAGVENYASTESETALQLSKVLGLSRLWMASSYNSNVPESTDALLGIRYILSDSLLNKDYELIETQPQTNLYENNNTLPLIMQSRLLQTEYTYENSFEFQNDFFENLYIDRSIDESVFKKIDYQAEIHTTEQGTTIDMTIEDKSNNNIYIELPDMENKLTVTNSEGATEITVTLQQNIYDLGQCDSRGKMFLQLPYVQGLELSDVHVYSQDISTLNQYVAAVNSMPVLNLKKISSSHLQFNTNTDSETVYTSTIPYDKNWRIYVDGNLIPSSNDMGYFLSFQIPAGEHSIDMIYKPKGFNTGLVISIGSLIVFLVSEIYCKKWKRAVLPK